jgi:hypothetical protein
MLNQLIVLVNLIGLFLIDAFLLADISITQTVPATMDPGTEVRVNVNVEKGSLSGFAKLQLDLPAGMSVTAIETKGASFTFSDNKAKFIWMSLPTTNSFTLSYSLSAASSMSGLQTITGRLSYIENNERKTYELPAARVDLGTPGPSARTTPAPARETPAPVVVPEPVVQVQVAQPVVEELPDNRDDLVSAAGGAPTTKAVIAVMDNFSGKPPMQGPGGVSATRKITPLSETEMQVEVTIRKSDIRGFGKLQESVPSGFTAIEQASEEAIFTAQDRIVKFVWLNLPARKELKVVYRLRSNTRPEGEYSIDGDFGYLLNDETQRVGIGTSKFYVGPKAMEALAQDEQRMDSQSQPDPKLDVQPKPKTEPVRTTEPARDKQQATATTKPAPTVIAGAEKGITFKVQITAAHREVGKAYFTARHRYSGEFSIERHQGWIKYVTGRFGTYREARDQRQDFIQAGHNFPGPFVTAYNNGERITVQEALLISNQKWVQ